MERTTLTDDYEHSESDVEYILENILQDDDGSDEYEELRKKFNSKIQKKCEKNEIDCKHGGNYEKVGGKLRLNENRQCLDLIYECTEECDCKFCCNKLVQFGPRDDLKIQHFPLKGLGLVSTKPIKKGSFVCEYAGEILTKSEAIRRDRNDKKMNYIFCLNEINSEGNSKTIQTFIDPSRKGNIGRYINHSCDANCDIISTRVDSIIPKIAIFTNRDLPAYTEITFNYGAVESIGEKEKKCFCNSQNCKIYLPNISFQ